MIRLRQYPKPAIRPVRRSLKQRIERSAWFVPADAAAGRIRQSQDVVLLCFVILVMMLFSAFGACQRHALFFNAGGAHLRCLMAALRAPRLRQVVSRNKFYVSTAGYWRPAGRQRLNQQFRGTAEIVRIVNAVARAHGVHNDLSFTELAPVAAELTQVAAALNPRLSDERVQIFERGAAVCLLTGKPETIAESRLAGLFGLILGLF